MTKDQSVAVTGCRMTGDDIRHGGCLCGAVRYRVKGEMRDVIACHCTQCRKQSGHYYAATQALRANLMVKGLENITDYRASDDATRSFCKICGSALFWTMDGSEHTSILAGSLDSPTGLKLTRHIFCADTGDYYDIADELAHFDGDGV